MLKGGLPRWFDLSDEQVNTARWTICTVTAALVACVFIALRDPFEFAGLVVMLLFFIGPAGIISAIFLPSHRLRIFVLPPIYIVVFVVFLLNSKHPNVIGSTTALSFYVFFALSIAVILPEIRFVKRFFPSLRFNGMQQVSASDRTPHT